MNHNEPTYENQLWQARKLLAEKGRDALNNPHAMIGRTCKCGSCFCCAAAQVIQEFCEIPNCPNCNGERELSGKGGYICFFCGREENSCTTA